MDLVSLALPAFSAALFTTIGGLLVWYFQSRAEKLRSLEEGLHERRLQLYSDTLDPLIRLFASLEDPKSQVKGLSQITSVDYRKTVFDFTMFGTDEVVQAYNGMFHHIYEAERTGQQDSREMMRLWGGVLLAIRKSGGNPDTKLDEWDMLAGLIKDVDTLRYPGAAEEPPAEANE